MFTRRYGWDDWRDEHYYISNDSALQCCAIQHHMAGGASSELGGGETGAVGHLQGRIKKFCQLFVQIVKQFMISPPPPSLR